MQIQMMTIKDPEKVFITARNESGDVLADGQLVYWLQTDPVSVGVGSIAGLGVSLSGLEFAPAGFVNSNGKTVINGAFCMLQVYGVITKAIADGVIAANQPLRGSVGTPGSVIFAALTPGTYVGTAIGNTVDFPDGKARLFIRLM